MNTCSCLTLILASIIYWQAENTPSLPASNTNGAEPQGLVERIKRLVRGLDDDNFQIRERSEQQLIKIGKPALQAVEEATKSSSQEVRFRATRALMKIRQKIRIASISSLQPPVNELAVVLLDNCDPNFKGNGPHEDGVHAPSLSSERGSFFSWGLDYQTKKIALLEVTLSDLSGQAIVPLEHR